MCNYVSWFEKFGLLSTCYLFTQEHFLYFFFILFKCPSDSTGINFFLRLFGSSFRLWSCYALLIPWLWKQCLAGIFHGGMLYRLWWGRCRLWWWRHRLWWWRWRLRWWRCRLSWCSTGSDDGDAVLLSQEQELSLKAAPHKQIRQGCISSLKSCPVESCSSFSARKTRAFAICPHASVCFIFCLLYFLFPRTWVLVVSEYRRISCVLHLCMFAHTVLSNTLLPCSWEWQTPDLSSVTSSITSSYKSLPHALKQSEGVIWNPFMSSTLVQITTGPSVFIAYLSVSEIDYEILESMGHLLWWLAWSLYSSHWGRNEWRTVWFCSSHFKVAFWDVIPN